MRSYECAVIFRPTVSDDGLQAGTIKYANVIESNGGELTKLETWGKRRLAYEIEDHFEGHYFFYRFRGNNGVLGELGRQMRIDEDIIRHMIVVEELATGSEPRIAADELQPTVREEKEREEERYGSRDQEEKRTSSRT